MSKTPGGRSPFPLPAPLICGWVSMIGWADAMGWVDLDKGSQWLVATATDATYLAWPGTAHGRRRRFVKDWAIFPGHCPIATSVPNFGRSDASRAAVVEMDPISGGPSVGPEGHACGWAW